MQDPLNRKPLAYRLRESVQYHPGNGFPILVQRFPLRFVALHPFWRAVFDCDIDRNYIPFDEIRAGANHVDPAKTEIFLNGLVRKGFLEQEGFPILPDDPCVSIIIPVRNRAETITACLQSMKRLDYPSEKLEVIVVDDASDDHTTEVVSTFPVQLISLKEHRQASFCRNLGARRARGEILAFLDSDCTADPSWLKELIPAFTDPSNGAVGGLVDSYFSQKGLDYYEKVKSSLNLGSWPKSSREDKRFFYLPACNLLVRRVLFLQLGGFNEHMVVGEDVDLCWRLQDQGHHVEYRPVGKVYHQHRNKVREFCLRRFDYGTSEPFLQRSHSKRIKQFVISPPAFIFWGLVFLSIASGWIPPLGLGGGIVLVDSLMKFTRIRRKHVPIHFPRLLLSTFRSYFVFCYHVCTFVSRYYLLWAFLIFMLSPLVSAILLGMHLLTGAGEYLIRKPRLNFPLFLFYFTLDQLSYQLGVWWGCLKECFFRPVNPQIVKKSSGDL
ncbi:MAG: mycofactocin biosynthesis glycosyltransferase MftF [Proteobacteria bacterium]|nr:mycofactocin biosynthesis glycosyltransferase MftF [Pseudomonadota bacterium]